MISKLPLVPVTTSFVTVASGIYVKLLSGAELFSPVPSLYPKNPFLVFAVPEAVLYWNEIPRSVLVSYA